MRQDKLRKQGGQKNNAFGIGEIYEHRALKQFAARLRLRQRIQVDRPCRPPLLDTQPDQVGGAGPFQHLKGQHRAGEESAETNANQHDMNGQPSLQTGNRRRRAAVSVVNGSGHGINRSGTRRQAENN